MNCSQRHKTPLAPRTVVRIRCWSVRVLGLRARLGMAKRQGMSKGEMDVARVLWEIGPAPVRKIHAALSADLEIDFATVQTYLRRLEAKG